MNRTINGINVNYEEKGEGELIVLLHGWGSNIKLFANLIDLLSKKYKVVGISSERLVFDVDYDPELVTIPKGFMKFDKSTAKIRYVWRAVYY